MFKKTLYLSLVIFSTPGLADGFSPTIIPTGLSKLNVILPNPGGAISTNLRLNVYYSCLGMNLRGASNPARVNRNPTANSNDTITGYIPIDGLSSPLWFSTPSIALRQYEAPGIQPSSLGYPQVGANRLHQVSIGPVNAGGTASGATYRTYMLSAWAPSAVTSQAVIQQDGSIIPAVLPTIRTPYFCQAGAPPTNRPNLACPGQPDKQRIDAAITPVLSPSGELSIYAQFPIAIGGANSSRCNYASPLMLFTDRDLPVFTGESGFALENEAEQKYGWPQAGAPGHFLARDLNGNGLIDNGGELFGNLTHSSGFAALEELDSNDDGQIDRRDTAFNSLLLWNDANGDGISQAAELSRLVDYRSSLQVTSISLKANLGRSFNLGSMAKGHGESSFRFKDKKGRTKTGRMIDVYFRDL